MATATTAAHELRTTSCLLRSINQLIMSEQDVKCVTVLPAQLVCTQYTGGAPEKRRHARHNASMRRVGNICACFPVGLHTLPGGDLVDDWYQLASAAIACLAA